MATAGLEEAQAGIKIARRNIDNLRYADNTTFMAESEEKLEPLDKSERGEGKSWLKAQHSENEDHGIWSHHIMRNSGLEEAQAGIKIAGRNIINLTYADDTTLMAESEEKLKSLLMKVKEESEKVGFKAQHLENEDHGIWSHHFMGNKGGNSGNSV